jgi:hypothetical protein
MERRLHNARPTLWNAPWRLESVCSVLVLDRPCFDYRSTLDEKEYAMSAMGNYYLTLQTDAIDYLAEQGIDKELLWDVSEDSYHFVVALAEMHRNDVSIDTIKRIMSEAHL